MKELNLVFYNFENLFDTYDDPKINDQESLPRGDRHWTAKRFNEKIAKISKVLISSCGLSLPDIVGCCEVENRFVLESLIDKTPLSKFDYKIIHKDSPDHRGIDVALLYRRENCIPISFEYIPLKDENGDVIPTREILHVCFQLIPNDTIHVFINHWPSRYGGQMETEQKRIIAARCLRSQIDNLRSDCADPKIVLMGDFNDEPKNPSVYKWLGAVTSDNLENYGELVNLSALWNKNGTLKHLQSWAVFDQFIVSDNLLAQKNSWWTQSSFAEILSFDFLLQNDPKFQGKKLFRTYNGFKYNGGFSDHLPIHLKLVYPH